MLRTGLIRRDLLFEQFLLIEPLIIRYPALDPKSFRAVVAEFCQESSEELGGAQSCTGSRQNGFSDCLALSESLMDWRTCAWGVIQFLPARFALPRLVWSGRASCIHQFAAMTARNSISTRCWPPGGPGPIAATTRCFANSSASNMPWIIGCQSAFVLPHLRVLGKPKLLSLG